MYKLLSSGISDIEEICGDCDNLNTVLVSRSIYITDKSCAFCSQYLSHTSDNFWSQVGSKYGQETDVIYETQYSLLIAGMGAITEGYVLLLPKTHFLSIASLPPLYLNDLEKLKRNVTYALHDLYGSVNFFEHGCASHYQPGGACVDHAHLHAFPSSIDLLDKIKVDFPEIRITSIQEISEIVGLNRPYLYYENNKGEKFSFIIPDKIPSQYMRRIWAKALEKEDEWDWALFINEKNVVKTIEKLSAWFFHNKLL